jgi:FkbH-like protein
MRYYIFRNTTVERFFQHIDADFSGYEDVSVIDSQSDRFVWFYLAPIETENMVIARKINYYANLVQMVAEKISSGKMFILFTLKNIFSIQSISSDQTIADAIYNYNTILYDLASKNRNIKIIDFAKFLDNYDNEELIDWKYYFISQIGLNPRLADAFQNWFSAEICAIELKRKKCLVLDLDNTLWGGILGEDGITGVALGGDYPGKAYLMFQRQLLALSKEGIILTVCSKNNMEDVLRMWNDHPDSALKEEYFAAMRINWNNKADNIREIAQELNIGLDSLVFIDDNSSERELIRQVLPEVATPDFPEQPYMLPVFFKKLVKQYFCLYELTDEDLQKTAQYKANVARANTRKTFTNMDEYIRSLEIELKINEINELTLTRAAQMTQKTNQFNLTAHRYTDADLKEKLAHGHRIYTLSIRDKFGDSGITGLCIVELSDNSANINSLLLSCRILGKDIESAFLSCILKDLKNASVTRVTSMYIPTTKNEQVKNFYEKQGFILDNEDMQHTKYYSLDLLSKNIIFNRNYRFI